METEFACRQPPLFAYDPQWPSEQKTIASLKPRLIAQLPSVTLITSQLTEKKLVKIKVLKVEDGSNLKHQLGSSLTSLHSISDIQRLTLVPIEPDQGLSSTNRLKTSDSQKKRPSLKDSFSSRTTLINPQLSKTSLMAAATPAPFYDPANHSKALYNGIRRSSAIAQNAACECIQNYSNTIEEDSESEEDMKSFLSMTRSRLQKGHAALSKNNRVSRLRRTSIKAETTSQTNGSNETSARLIQSFRQEVIDSVDLVNIPSRWVNFAENTDETPSLARSSQNHSIRRSISLGSRQNLMALSSQAPLQQTSKTLGAAKLAASPHPNISTLTQKDQSVRVPIDLKPELSLSSSANVVLITRPSYTNDDDKSSQDLKNNDNQKLVDQQNTATQNDQFFTQSYYQRPDPVHPYCHVLKGSSGGQSGWRQVQQYSQDWETSWEPLKIVHIALSKEKIQKRAKIQSQTGIDSIQMPNASDSKKKVAKQLFSAAPNLVRTCLSTAKSPNNRSKHDEKHNSGQTFRKEPCTRLSRISKTAPSNFFLPSISTTAKSYPYPYRQERSFLDPHLIATVLSSKYGVSKTVKPCATERADAATSNIQQFPLPSTYPRANIMGAEGLRTCIVSGAARVQPLVNELDELDLKLYICELSYRERQFLSELEQVLRKESVKDERSRKLRKIHVTKVFRHLHNRVVRLVEDQASESELSRTRRARMERFLEASKKNLIFLENTCDNDLWPKAEQHLNEIKNILCQ
ncbi:hypothetical protein BDV3_003516 [Batrachochytrium dendrobatidis]